jgi:hypothetical protein
MRAHPIVTFGVGALAGYLFARWHTGTMGGKASGGKGAFG